MNAIRDVWINIETGLRRFGLDDQSIIQRAAQTAYYELCLLTDWQLLRRSVSVACVATTGTLLPADLIGIMSVIDADGNEVDPSEQQTRKFRGREKKSWHFVQSEISPLYDGKSLTVEQDAASITVSPAISSAFIGEYAHLNSEPGFYKLASVSTITPAYRGPRIQGGTITIRPSTCRKLAVVDEDGDDSTEIVTVHYWAFPEPLYQDWQRPMLPSSRIIELKTIINILGFHEKQERAADNYRTEFDKALADAYRLNPKFRVPLPPQASSGLGLKFGRR